MLFEARRGPQGSWEKMGRSKKGIEADAKRLAVVEKGRLAPVDAAMRERMRKQAEEYKRLNLQPMTMMD